MTVCHPPSVSSIAAVRALVGSWRGWEAGRPRFAVVGVGKILVELESQVVVRLEEPAEWTEERLGGCYISVCICGQ